MRILVVGSGGREHALCWAIAASPLCTRLWCAPGNGGIAAVAECVPLAADDLDVFERCQKGLEDQASDWVDLSRGVAMDKVHADGSTIAPGTSELPIRNQFSAWANWMKETPA